MRTGSHDLRCQATPADFARAMTGLPLISTSGTNWSRLAMERFQVPSFSLKLGPSSVHRLTLHLAGPVEIARERDGHTDRK